MSDSLRPHEPQHTRPPCPSPTPGVYPNSCPLSWWCHLTISSSVVPFSTCPQSFPASGSFQMSQLFESSGQSIRVSASASILPMNIQDWFPVRLTKGLGGQAQKVSTWWHSCPRNAIHTLEPGLSLHTLQVKKGPWGPSLPSHPLECCGKRCLLFCSAVRMYR